MKSHWVSKVITPAIPSSCTSKKKAAKRKTGDRDEEEVEEEERDEEEGGVKPKEGTTYCNHSHVQSDTCY